MQFTPQQLSGGPRYGSSTRVGNWLEERHLEEEMLADFGRSQSAGKLVTSEMHAKEAKYLRPATLSPELRFGSVVMVAHLETGCALAVDLTETLHESQAERKLVTATPRAEPVARTAFTVLPVDKAKEAVVTYGTPIHLVTHVDDQPYYLASALKTSFNASRLANQAPVFVTANASTDAVWTCEKVAPKNTGVVRHLAAGEDPVPASHELGATPIVLQHRSTNQALAADRKYADLTDFGRELEVTCHNHYGNEKVEALCSEMAGRTTAATNARLEHPANYWQFLLATPP